MNKVEVAFHKGYRIDKNGVPYGVRGKPLTTDFTNNNYQQFTMNVGGKFKTIRVHRLQAYQKFGRKALQKDAQVRHLNGDKLDNSWDNIGIGTALDNMMDIPIEARHTRAVQGGRVRSNLSIEDVLELRRLREKEGWTYARLAEKFGMTSSSVGCIVRRETWCEI